MNRSSLKRLRPRTTPPTIARGESGVGGASTRDAGERLTRKISIFKEITMAERHRAW
jgi:hypothetical protein